MDGPEKRYPVTPCMDVYKSKIKSDRSIEKLKAIIALRGDFHNKEIIGQKWSPTVSIGSMKYFLADATNHKARLHQLDFIGSFIQATVKHIYFLKFDSRYG